MREVDVRTLPAALRSWLYQVWVQREAVRLVSPQGVGLFELVPCGPAGLLLRRLVDTPEAVQLSMRIVFQVGELLEEATEYE